jgi:hypothetical protein
MPLIHTCRRLPLAADTAIVLIRSGNGNAFKPWEVGLVEMDSAINPLKFYAQGQITASHHQGDD